MIDHHTFWKYLLEIPFGNTFWKKVYQNKKIASTEIVMTKI